MTMRDPIPRGYDELGSRSYDELSYDDGEMIMIAEKAIECFKEALKNPDHLISETVSYRDIPHHNSTRTPGVLLALRGRPLKSVSISIPRKDDSTAIRIDALDESNPNRFYVLSEVEDIGEALPGFEIGDSDWENAERANMGVDNFMESHEVAHWLYRQAGLSEDEVIRKLKTESDPVQDAAHAAGQRAAQIVTQRQIKVPVRDGLFLYGEEISVQTPDELTLQKPATDIPTARPIRMYNLWTNAVYDTEQYGGVREQLICNLSPDNPFLLIPNPRSGLFLSVETTKALTSTEKAALYSERSQQYTGNVASLFESIQQEIAQANTQLH